MCRYHEQVSEQDICLAKETPRKLALEAAQRQIQKELIQSRDVLAKLYSYNIIYPKYRKLEFVCSLYEYLCAGRCTTLEGHEGGYNILEQEIRLDHIISQVDRVINNLNSIKYSQVQLYNAVMDSNQRLNRIIASTDRMASQVSYLGNQTSAINSRLADLQR